MGKGPFKMKGHTLPGPNQKESPMKVAPWLAAAAAKAAPYIPHVVGAVIAGGTSVGIASAKAKETRRKEQEQKKIAALEKAGEGISEEIEGKTDLLKA